MEMKKTKKMCLTHMFNYSGAKCPFCEQERIDHMCKKFNKQEKVEMKHVESKEVTMEDIEKLKAKFNSK